jgi:hypothetical protein
MARLPLKARLRTRLRGRYLAAFVIAAAAAVLSVYQVSLFPPGGHSRHWEIGTASTTLLIDTPQSDILNLHASTDEFGSLQARAALIGNLMATDPVKAQIARLVGIPPSRIQVTSPVTANVPQTLTEPGSGASASDLLASADHYKLQLQVDPTVPVLHIYAQAPSGGAAVDLANDSVKGLKQYLASLTDREGLNPAAHVDLTQLGSAYGGVINSGVSKEIALLVFCTAFASVLFAAALLRRFNVGWKLGGNELPAAQ